MESRKCRVTLWFIDDDPDEVAEYDLPLEEAKALLELLAQYEVTWALS